MRNSVVKSYGQMELITFSLFNLEGTRPGVLYGPVAQLARAYD